MNRLLVIMMLPLVFGCSDDESTVASAASSESTEDAFSDGLVSDDESEGSDVELTGVGNTKDVAVGSGGESDGEVSSDIAEEEDCVLNMPCDDGNSCSYDDKCNEDGLCEGVAYECEDDLSCTEDLCAGDGSCTHETSVTFCLIGGSCYEAGVEAPAGFCGVCDPEISQSGWSSGGEVCDDGDPCTVAEGKCEEGLCIADGLNCDDGDVCTQDQCGDAGCENSFVFLDCDDDDECTLNDVCLEGLGCAGTGQLDCNDDNPCTEDSCDNGCQFVPAEGLCSDGDFCTWDDVCDEGVCKGQNPAICEDGNSCTVGVCESDKGCIFNLIENPCCTGSQNICDDGDVCTLDTCDLETEACTNEPLDGSCNDGNPCTFGDTCFNGLCLGFDQNCDDGNDCTLDSCTAADGCVSEPNIGLACNDGVECTINDVCTSVGTCKGDTSECVCEPEFSPVVSKLTSLQVGADGNPGEGLDLDGDASTCAPATNCSNGVDNGLSALGSFANASLEESIDNGEIVMILEHVGFNQAGEPFKTNFHLGALASEGEGCNAIQQNCDYVVEPSGFDDACNAVVQIKDVIVEDGQLTGGGKGTEFPITLPLSADAIIDVTLYDVQIAGAVLGADDDFILEGVIGGAVKKSDLITAIKALPEDSFPAGLSPDVVLALLDSILVLDIDTDGDGVNEAVSAGLPFVGIPGAIVGLDE